MKIVYQCGCGNTARPKVLPAPKKHAESYQKFIETLTDAPKGLPLHGAKRRRFAAVTVSPHPWFHPIVRGSTKRTLIPPPNTRPCKLCANANYNQKCFDEGNCAAMLYWTLIRVQQHVDAGAEKAVALFTQNEEKKPCGVPNVKQPTPTHAKIHIVSSAGKTPVTLRPNSSTKAPAKSSAKRAPRKSKWQKKSKTPSTTTKRS